MDPEQAFLRVHARLSGMLSQLLTSRIRTALEYVSFVVAVSLFCLTVVMHINFVQQPGCSSELLRAEIAEAPLVEIKITSSGLWSQNITDHDVINTPGHGSSTENLQVPDTDGDGLTYLAPKFWLNWISSGARSKLIPIPSKSDEEFFEPQAETMVDSSSSKLVADKAEVRVDAELQHIVFPISSRDEFKAAVIHFCSKWHMYWNTAGWDMAKDVPKSLHMFQLERLKSFLVQWLEKRSKAFEPTYLYTVEKGYFLLPEGAKSQHNVTTVNITISAQHSCFGNRWQKLIINSFVGYDTILMNSLLNSPGQGYLYNFQTKEFYDLNYARQPAEGFARFTEYLVTKCGVLIMSLFVFFTTTMSVSFTLRETQARMLKFTVQLQHHALHRLPTFQLIFVHVIESLVFVPIMIGILFFLFEFYDDQMLAFMVLTLVWLCELFTMISVRTPMSIQFFPRFFLLYFLVFHIYFFSYAYGFSYLAFSTTAAFMQHLILCFWNRFEVPALLRFMQSRSQLQQQQLGVHITSSILTSTLHIARVNMRNPIPVNNELGSWPWSTRPGPGQTRTDAVDGAGTTGILETMENETTDMAGGLRLPRSDPQQTEVAPTTTSLNSFSSLLLWMLGSSSSDSLVSFFSIFRDMRDQGQVNAESPQHESSPATQNSWWRRTRDSERDE